MQTYDVEIIENYKCIATVVAESEEQAIEITKKLYEAGVIEIDSEDITDTQYLISK